MSIQNRYFVNVKTSENKSKTVVVYGFNELEAKGWALKVNGVKEVLSVTCDGPAIEETED